jgi:hypothetical protein
MYFCSTQVCTPAPMAADRLPAALPCRKDRMAGNSRCTSMPMPRFRLVSAGGGGGEGGREGEREGGREGGRKEAGVRAHACVGVCVWGGGEGGRGSAECRRCVCARPVGGVRALGRPHLLDGLSNARARAKRTGTNPCVRVAAHAGLCPAWLPRAGEEPHGVGATVWASPPPHPHPHTHKHMHMHSHGHTYPPPPAPTLTPSVDTEIARTWWASAATGSCSRPRGRSAGRRSRTRPSPATW